MIETSTIWIVIILLGLGTFLIRFSFLGLIGDRKLPRWITLHLNYVAVAVMPALVAPLVVWPEATGGALDAPRLLAALAALAAGLALRSALWSVSIGFGVLYFMLFVVS
ncbi:membrane protein [Amylibacter marinus]|uniref:Membrane protein n=1 Tax=Amylibacter marinus TaxID=1475483 RepID=A0ABQ5VXD7_9RHOB|nr:AzlD domain-containing protein [Amylibacter marinus]GLQ35867.1 membrane protein [Amylibacter marinus]